MKVLIICGKYFQTIFQEMSAGVVPKWTRQCLLKYLLLIFLCSFHFYDDIVSKVYPH